MFDLVYYKNDTLITLIAVKNIKDNTSINNATIQILSISEYGGLPIDTNLFPITLAYVTGSVGNYSGIIPNTLNLVPKKRYVCKIQATTQLGFKAYWEFIFTCKLRQN